MQSYPGSYDLFLVPLSVLVAILSSFVALISVTRIYASTNRKWDAVWIIAFGLSLGSGIWGMHFVAMLAFNLPIPVQYASNPTLLSLLLAIGVCSLAIIPLRSGQAIGRMKAMLLGVIVGSGISAMHYTGMAAMVMNARMQYQLPVVVLSIVMAMLVSAVALMLFNHFRDSRIFKQLGLKVTAAVVMGIAVSSMHYTAMMGVEFYPTDFQRTLSNHIDSDLLAALVIVIVSLIQGGVFTTAILDESHKTTLRRAEATAALYDVLAESHSNRPLHEILDRCLNIILNVSWLSVESKGSVFIAQGEVLHMTAAKNLNASLMDLCRYVEFGTCLCGLAAQQKNVVYKDCVDHQHEIRPEGIQPHGHYCVPIVEQNETLGVLNLYVMEGHRQSPLEEQFLKTVSRALASVIRQKQMERRLAQMSYEDPLTGIGNRRRFNDSINHALKITKREKRRFAVLLIDLDAFKPVNDRHGHDVGDKLLIGVCRRIEGCLREMDLLTRMGGDEFAVLLERVNDAPDIRQVANRILSTLSEPFTIEGHQITIGASMGASLFPDHGTSVDKLLKQADLALYQAKRNRGELCIASAAKAIIS